MELGSDILISSEHHCPDGICEEASCNESQT